MVKVKLSDFVPLIGLQFSFSNSDVIPPSVKHQKKETPEESNKRGSCSSGNLIIKPTENCSLVELLNKLEVAGYNMIDAFYQERIDPKDPNSKRIFHMVRFLFSYRGYVEPSDEFRERRSAIWTELRNICQVALWRVKVFSNPFYKDGKEIPGQRALSINLEARKPLFYPDGQPVMVWPKDKNGKHLGDASLPLKPDYCLRIKKSAICLKKA